MGIYPWSDENGETTKRGRTRLKETWNLPKGQRIVVQCNELNQPVGKEATRLGNFLGTVARNGKLCSLSYKDWRKLIGEREKKTNEQRNKRDILAQVKVHLECIKSLLLTSLCFTWRYHILKKLEIDGGNISQI